MITIDGYSKDTSIMPEGIVVTLGSDMIAEQGGLRTFLKGFLADMADENTVWMHKLRNAPKFDIPHVYVIVHGRLYGRCFYGGYRKAGGNYDAYTTDGRVKRIDWAHILLAGPFERCPFKRQLKGFQGFRYSTKLF